MKIKNKIITEDNLNIINQVNKNISTKEKLKSEEVEFFIKQKKKVLRAKNPNKKNKHIANSYGNAMDNQIVSEFDKILFKLKMREILGKRGK